MGRFPRPSADSSKGGSATAKATPPKKRKAVGKDNVDKIVVPEETLQPTMLSKDSAGCEAAESRPRAFLDDAMCCVEFVANLVKGVSLDMAAVGAIMAFVWEFFFKSEVVFNGNSYTKWSALRPALRGHLIRLHMAGLVHLVGGAADDADKRLAIEHHCEIEDRAGSDG